MKDKHQTVEPAGVSEELNRIGNLWLHEPIVRQRCASNTKQLSESRWR
jgi:hypothetical protein